MTKPIPDGKHTVTPHLVVRGAAEAIEFYKKAFGAEELIRMPMPNGKLMHACIQIGDSQIMMTDEMDSCPNGSKSPQSLAGFHTILHVYVDNVDEAFKVATDAGASSVMPPQDMFWGDRYGQVKDPFGHVWSLATHKEDLTREQIEARAKACMQQMASAK